MTVIIEIALVRSLHKQKLINDQELLECEKLIQERSRKEKEKEPDVARFTHS